MDVKFAYHYVSKTLCGEGGKLSEELRRCYTTQETENTLLKYFKIVRNINKEIRRDTLWKRIRNLFVNKNVQYLQDELESAKNQASHDRQNFITLYKDWSDAKKYLRDWIKFYNKYASDDPSEDMLAETTQNLIDGKQ